MARFKKIGLSALIVLVIVLGVGVKANAATYGGGGAAYLHSQINAHRTNDTNYYYYTGNFFMWSYGTSTYHQTYYENGWGKWTDAIPGQVQNDMYNPQVVDGRAYLGGPASEFGWATTSTRWNGTRLYTPSGVTGASNVRYVRAAQTDYRRAKTNPESKGVVSQSGAVVIGNNYWVKPNTTLKVRIDGYQDWNGTDATMILEDYVNVNWLRLTATGVEAKAYITRAGAFTHHTNSAHFDITKDTSSVSAVKTLQTTFNITPTQNNSTYSIQSYSSSANGKTHGYIDTGKDIKTDGTAPTNPTINLSNTGWSNADVTATLSHGTDAGVGVDRSQYKIGTGAWTNYSTTLTFTSSSTLYARTIDKLGNISGTTTANISIDRVSPNVVSSALTGAQYVSGNDHWFAPGRNFVYDNTGHDAHAGIQHQYIRLLGNTDIRAHHNWAEASTHFNPWIKANGAVLTGVTRSTNSGGNRRLLWAGTTEAYDYDYNVMYYYNDYAGNTIGYNDTGLNMRIDASAPAAPGINLSNTSWTNGNVSVTLSHGADSRSGVDKSQYKIGTGAWTDYTAAFTVSTAGTTTIYGRTIDKVGNISGNSSDIVYIDKTAPTVSLSPNSMAGWQNAGIPFTATFADAGGSGFNDWKVRYETNGVWGAFNAVNTTTSSSSTLTGNGQRRIQYVVTDKAGNSTTHTSGNYYVDTTAPNGTTSISPTEWTNGNVTITLNASDTGGSGVKDVRIAGGSWITGSSTTRTVTANGTYSFEVRDNAGNTATIATTVNNIDKTVPVININPNGNGVYQKTQSAIVTVTDAASGVATRQYGWSSNTTTVPTWINFASGASISSPINTGDHYLWVKATDVAGNESIVKSNVFRVDNTLPEGVITPSITSWTNGNVTLTINTTDAHAGVKQVRISGGTWVTGNTTSRVVTVNGTYSFEIEDNAGNLRTVAYTVSNIDKVAPTGTTTISPSIWTNGNVTITLSANDTGGSGYYRTLLPSGAYSTSATPTHTVTTNGNYNFTVYDNAGNSRVVTQVVSNIDKVAPTGTTSISPSIWTNGNVTITLTTADTGGSGYYRTLLPSGAYSTSTAPTHVVSANGTYSFTVYDNAGNSTVVTRTVSNIDKVIPTGTTTISPTAWTNGTVTITLAASDTGGSGYYRTLLPNATYSTSATPTYVVSVNGTYSFTVFDNAGNSSVITRTVSNIDTSKPSGLFVPNGATWRNTGLNVTFTPSDTGGSNVANWKWSLSSNNGTTYGAETTVSSGSAGVIAVPNTEGLWRIRVVVTDNAGNVETLVSNVYQIDKTLPLGVFTPNSQTWTNGSITTSFNPSDLGGSGVKSWRYRTAQNGSTYGAWSSVINGSTALNIVLSGQGTWRVQAEVTDNADNVNTLTSGLFNIDTTLPSGVFTPNSATWRNTGLTVSFNPSDTGGSGVKEWRFRTSSNNGSAYGAWSAMVVGETTSNIVIPNAEGLWRTQVEVYDIAGSVQTLTSGVYQVDKSLPSGLFSPNSRVWGGTGLTVSFDPSDTGGSGVKNWRYQISSNDGTTFGSWSGLIAGDTTSSITIPSASNRYVIQVEVNDTAGNTRVFRSGVYLVDTTKPTGVFTPSSATWTKNTVTTSFNPDDGVGSGVQRWRYRIAQNGNVATPTYGVWSAYVLGDTISNISMTTQGEWKIQVEVEDNVGNIEIYTSGVYHVDKTLPNVTFSPNNAAWRNSSVSVAINPTDYSGIGTSGLNNYRYRISSDRGATYGAYTNVAGSGISTVTFSTQGEWMIDVDVYDRATNTLNKKSGLYLIDTTVPNGSYSPNLGGWANTNLTTRFTPTDNTGIGGSAVKQYTWVHKLDGVVKATATVTGGGYKDFTFVEDGIHTVETLVTDNAGNTRQVNSGQFRIDKTKPLGSNTISYNEHTGVYTIVPSGIQDSLAVSSNISGMDRWVITFTAKNSAGSIIGTNSITRNVYIGNTIQNIHTMFNGRADKIEVTSRLYDVAGNYLDLQSRADEIFVVKTDITKVLTDGNTTAVVNVGKIVEVKGGELIRIKIEALGNPDKVVVTGIGRGILNPDEPLRANWVYGSYGKVLTNFNYTIYNTETAVGSGVVVNLTNAARVHSIYSSNPTTAKDVFVDIFQEAGEYDVKITAYKNSGVMYERTINHKVYVGIEPTIKELRTRLMFKLPGR